MHHMIAKLNSDGAAGGLAGREEFIKLLESLYPHDCKFVYILASHILLVCRTAPSTYVRQSGTFHTNMV
jgi:hypothetical protein